MNWNERGREIEWMRACEKETHVHETFGASEWTRRLRTHISSEIERENDFFFTRFVIFRKKQSKFIIRKKPLYTVSTALRFCMEVYVSLRKAARLNRVREKRFRPRVDLSLCLLLLLHFQHYRCCFCCCWVCAFFFFLFASTNVLLFNFYCVYPRETVVALDVYHIQLRHSEYRVCARSLCIHQVSHQLFHFFSRSLALSCTFNPTLGPLHHWVRSSSVFFLSRYFDSIVRRGTIFFSY